MMKFYTVRKKQGSTTPYLDRHGYGSFEPVAMDKAQAEHVAVWGGGVVQEWEGAKVREYEVAGPALPRLELDPEPEEEGEQLA